MEEWELKDSKSTSANNLNQVMKPLWPFFVGSALTFLGVARLQSAALAGACFHILHFWIVLIR